MKICLYWGKNWFLLFKIWSWDVIVIIILILLLIILTKCKERNFLDQKEVLRIKLLLCVLADLICWFVHWEFSDHVLFIHSLICSFIVIHLAGIPLGVAVSRHCVFGDTQMQQTWIFYPQRVCHLMRKRKQVHKELLTRQDMVNTKKKGERKYCGLPLSGFNWSNSGQVGSWVVEKKISRMPW